MTTETMSKAQSLTLVGIAYVVAIAVGAAWLVWGVHTGRLWLDTLIADVLATLVIFVFSRVYGNSSFYDAYWSVIPPVLLFYWWSQSGVQQLRCWLIAVVVVLWAIRLTANWLYAFPGLHHEDWRYPMFRERAGRWEFVVDLVTIHLIPTLLVFAGMLPVYVAVTRPGGDIGWLTDIAFVVGLAAVILELVADVQMHRFVRRSAETVRRWTADCGRGRGIRTTSGSSVSGFRWRCSVWPSRRRTPGGCAWERWGCWACSSAAASR